MKPTRQHLRLSASHGVGELDSVIVFGYRRITENAPRGLRNGVYETTTGTCPGISVFLSRVLTYEQAGFFSE